MQPDATGGEVTDGVQDIDHSTSDPVQILIQELAASEGMNRKQASSPVGCERTPDSTIGPAGPSPQGRSFGLPGRGQDNALLLLEFLIGEDSLAPQRSQAGKFLCDRCRRRRRHGRRPGD